MGTELDIGAIDELFERLLELPPAKREAHLSSLQHSQPGQARMLRRLLELSNVSATGDLRALADSASGDAEAPDVPGYAIVREIGRGGMGAVYEAVRTIHGTEQPVAIKVLRAAILDPVEHQRFINEQRILARLQHPNVAVILDAGSVGGRPYMVLERIDGLPVDERLCPPAAPDAVFDAIAQVLDALQLAHEHFIVHRDIKPGNVLVDAAGRIKLIDFGIAKMLGEAQGADASATRTGRAPLTLRYASPEQLLGQPVGVASDIYQVGLLMYRLLTGAWPFDEDERQLPALRTRPDIRALAPSRRIADRRLRRRLAGDVDSIVLHCLELEPTRRYRSVAELKDDLARHRASRPVLARRHTRGYLLRSFVARHRLGVALAAAALVLVLVATAGSISLAQRSQAYARSTERILDTVTEMFAPANPFADAALRDLSVADAVDRTAVRFLGAVDADPGFHVAMLERLADMKNAFRAFDQQQALLRRAADIAAAHGLPRPTRARIAASLAEALFGQGDHDGARALVADALPDARGPYATRLRFVAAKVAIEKADYALAQSAFADLLADLDQPGLDALFRSHVHSSHGILMRRTGRLDEAIAAYEAAQRELDPARLDHQEQLLGLPVNIAIVHGQRGDYVASDREFTRALAQAVARVGEAHPTSQMIARNYATLLARTGRLESAYRMLLPLRPHALASETRQDPIDHLERLASSAFYTGRVHAAYDAQLESIDLALGFHGAKSTRLAPRLDALAWMLFESGESGLAGRFAEASLALRPQGSQRSVLALALLPGDGALRQRALAAFDDEAVGGCAGIERRALEGLLAGQPVAPTRLSDACYGSTALRLRALGFEWAPAWSATLVPERFDSPLVARLANGTQGRTDLAPDDSQRTRMAALLARLQGPPS